MTAIRAIGVGIAAGAALFAVLSAMFIKGCPVVDFFIEHDTIHYF